MSKITRIINILGYTPSKEGNTLRVFSLRQFEIEEDLLEGKIFDGYSLRTMRKECVGDQPSFRLGFFMYKGSKTLCTDVPGKCISMKAYKKALELTYDENAEALSIELNKLAPHCYAGRVWVYLTTCG